MVVAARSLAVDDGGLTTRVYGMLLRSLLVLAIACTASQPRAIPPPRTQAVFDEAFEDPATVRQRWVATLPATAGAHVHLAEGAVQLTVPAGKTELVLEHRLEIASLRGRRLRVRARIRSELPPGALARVDFSVLPAGGAASYADVAASRAVDSAQWTAVEAVLDVGADAMAGKLGLVLRGGGSAWFDDVAIEDLGAARRPVPAKLTPRQLDHLVTLAHVVAQLRYLHPSDQAATADWDTVIPLAVERVLAAADRVALRDALRALFAPIAPTVVFATREEPMPSIALPRGTGTHLARWRHAGLGRSGPYLSLREGRDAEPDVAIERSLALEVERRRCRSLRLEASVRERGDGKATLALRFLLPGTESKDLEHEVTTDQLTISGEIPPTTHRVELVVRLAGRGSITLDGATIACDGKPRESVDLARTWEAVGSNHLYTWTAQTRTLERAALDTAFVPERDVAIRDIGSGLRLAIPLAVWADTKQTLPAIAAVPVRRTLASGDLPVRLAAVASAWATLSLFYPYFADQRIDWVAALPVAFTAAASATTHAEVHGALSRLIARLQDDHARVSHPGMPTTGTLPVAFRRFGDQLVVVAVLPEYAATLPIGTEVTAIDGARAREAYDLALGETSAATPGWAHYAAAWKLTLGPVGELRRLRVRAIDGSEREHVVPLLPREPYNTVLKEPRPKTGTELAPGIIYVDLEALTKDAWNAASSALERATGIVIDLRGYATSVARDVLARLTEREIACPYWQIPLVGTKDHVLSRWTIRPDGKRFGGAAVVLVDGRTASYGETLSQMIRDHKLAVFVGETTGGTNGNVNTFVVPGDFTVRFTGLRADGPGGETIQGRGITPGTVVRPTLAGVRASRDEQLEAAVAEAQRLPRRGK